MQIIPAPKPRRYIPDPKVREKIQKLAALGLTEKEISAMVDVKLPTLRKHHKNDLVLGRSQGVSAVASALMKNAMGKSVKAQMFYLQCKGGWNPNKSDDLSELDIKNATTEQLRALLAANKANRG